ncbi:NAD(P)-binding protein [Cylindrobasidium torrendii FP15055 ss-10]|uniref:NAD(P)-binding protein n=1 Tax=Cylindrobasidium torrendii FP15055 ss-10 TaxID=1314674 RepID=A0A0D7BGP5_9AGAR|nr:NAD(P)-binding protein [Cylindrobasidium torrendii FP15055 ss-10]
MVQLTDAELWAEQKATKPLPAVSSDLAGKTIIVTGASNGLGLEASKHFAKMNPKKLILACRDLNKASVAVAEIGSAAAEAWQLDLSDFKSVVAFADRVERDLERLDILVANASIATLDLSVTGDGYEQMLQVNSLSNLLLSIRLTPILLKTAKANNTVSRLVTVSSNMFYGAVLDPALVKDHANIFKAISDPEYIKNPAVAASLYSITKLIQVCYTRTLQEYIGQEAPLSVSCVCPGFCYSNLRSGLTGPVKEYMEQLEKECAYTSEEGSRQLVFGAVGGDAEALKGQFVSMCRVREVSDYVLQSAELERRLWDNAVEILSAVDTKVQSTLETIAK